MDREIKKRIQRNSAIYGAFAVLLTWLIFFNDLKLGNFRSFLPYLTDQLASMSLSVILLPLLVSLLVYYVASLFNAVSEGALKEVIVGSLYAVGLAAFFALFLILSPGSDMLKSVGYLFLAAFTAMLLYNVISTLLRSRGLHELKVIAASATIYIEGQIAVRALELFLGSDGASLPGDTAGTLCSLLGLGFTVSAGVSLLGVLKTSNNGYLKVVGDISSNYLLIVPISLAGALYFNYFQGKLASISPGLANLSPYIEWTAICVIAALIFTRTRKGIQHSMMAEAKMGEWIKHVQEVGTYKDHRFVDLTGMVNEFIEQGHRDRLLVRLTIFLHENKFRDDEISTILNELINYEDEKKPVFSLRGRNSTIDVENEEKRRKTLQMTINTIIPTEPSETIGGMEFGGEREVPLNIEKKTEMDSGMDES
jgi:hypothetical protein